MNATIQLRLRHLFFIAAIMTLLKFAMASDLHVPAVVQAGHALSIPTEGSGTATLYLVGPDHAIKRNVTLGGEVQISDDDLRTAGRYRLTICSGECSSASFEVRASAPARLSFFLHPSRVPVSSPGSIDATAFVLDKYFNFIFTPTRIDFRVTQSNGAPFDRQATARNGTAWVRMDSTPHAGSVQVTAIVDGMNAVHESRVVQQVASEACNLRMKSVGKGILETDPVRDCSGNPLPDGTIVSFTKVGRDGRSTVDVPIKKGIARAQFTPGAPARVSVACGVVLGNDVELGGGL